MSGIEQVHPIMPHISTPGGERYDSAIDLSPVRAAHHALYDSRDEITADGNTAAALATLQMWRCVIFAGFPITPSTKWIETVAAKLGGDPTTHKRVKLLEAEHAVSSAPRPRAAISSFRPPRARSGSIT